MSIKWWYFKDIKLPKLKLQEKAALKTVPDHRYWLGLHPDASHRDCQNIKDLIYTSELEETNASKGPYPIQKGDEVWVYSLHCLGSDNKMIYEILCLLHREHIALHIYSLEKSKDPLLIQVFKELTLKSAARSKAKKKDGVGRPRVKLSYSMLNANGKKDVIRFCMDPHYKVKDAAKNLCQSSMYKELPPQGIPTHIGESKYYAIAAECIEILLADPKINPAELRKLGPNRTK